MTDGHDESRVIPEGTRVKIAVLTTSKGYAQRDIAVEAGSVGDATVLLRQAMDAWNDVVKEYGIPVAKPDNK